MTVTGGRRAMHGLCFGFRPRASDAKLKGLVVGPKTGLQVWEAGPDAAGLALTAASNSLGFPKPAGPRPETWLAGLVV